MATIKEAIVAWFGRRIGIGTLRVLIRHAGLTVETFLDLLDN